MRRDPASVALEVFASAVGALVALGLWWAIVAAIEGVERWWGW